MLRPRLVAPGADQPSRGRKAMRKVITTLIIALAGLWLAMPAAAQFEIDPDHFDFPATTAVHPRPEQSKGSMRISLPHKQAQRHRVQTSKGTKSPTSTTRTSSSAAAVQRRRRIGASRVGQTHADTKPAKQSRVAASLPYEWVPRSERKHAYVRCTLKQFAVDGWVDVEVEC